MAWACGGAVASVAAAGGGSRFLVRFSRVLFGSLGTSSRSLSSSVPLGSGSVAGGAGRSPGSGVRADRGSGSSDRTRRNLSATATASAGFLNQRRPLSRYDPLDLGDPEENTQKALGCKQQRRFIIDPQLAQVVSEHLAPDIEENNAIIFECNPGPGVLTRTLLNCGAQRVVALESDKSFLPDLQELEKMLDGQLEVLHCDFFMLDPIGQGSMKPPAMFSEKLFHQLSISEVPWTADVPVKVVGMFAQRNERNMLWKLIYSLFERLSVFRYGRIEFIMFISEKEYKKLTARPGDNRNYQALSVLWQMACDIELLHQEPWSSFVATPKHKRLSIPKSSFVPNDHLCLVRITPREDLFSSSITPYNSSTLVMMVKQCLAKRLCRVISKLDSWSLGRGRDVLLQMGLDEDVLTGQLYPGEYKWMFELMDKSEEFQQSWLYDEILEHNKNIDHI